MIFPSFPFLFKGVLDPKLSATGLCMVHFYGIEETAGKKLYKKMCHSTGFDTGLAAKNLVYKPMPSIYNETGYQHFFLILQNPELLKTPLNHYSVVEML